MAPKDAELRPIMTRLPEGLRQRLENEAARNGRSMNGEIIQRLERSFERDDHRKLIQDTATATAGTALESLKALIAGGDGLKPDVRSAFQRLMDGDVPSPQPGPLQRLMQTPDEKPKPPRGGKK